MEEMRKMMMMMMVGLKPPAPPILLLQRHLLLVLFFILLSSSSSSSFATSVPSDSDNHPGISASERSRSIKAETLPIDSAFDLPAPLPRFPSGGGFASGVVDLGGLLVRQVTTLSRVWSINGGGQDNLGVTFFEPTSVPEGYSMLGFYAQPNNRPLYGWVLVAKDSSGNAMKPPVDYTLVWSQDGSGYIWLPVPPDGYKAAGYVVTTSSVKPPLDKVRCVRSDLTAQTEPDEWMYWDGNAMTVSSSRPSDRGIQSAPVGAGTFVIQTGSGISPSMACLRNSALSNYSSMPNRAQIGSLVQVYSPIVYFHPDESYLPSTVNWFFTNGALLYTKGQEANPVGIDPTGSNLPQGGGNDGAYWLDLPIDGGAQGTVKRGFLQGSQAYLHVKPMFGATFTDIAVWLFYPFNGAARAKVKFFTVDLGKLGEHVGDWEHVTLRISNFDGRLRSVFFAQHSSGIRVPASGLEFQTGNKFVSYASLHGHASNPKQGTVLQGNNGVGVRNDYSRSGMFLDTGVNYTVLAAEYLGSSVYVEPPWVEFFREWGPNHEYDTTEQLKKVAEVLPGKLKTTFVDVMQSLPSDVLRQEGPTGPKMKPSWSGDE
ncbi:hypothetical protein MLD38_013672 [Melastoma candidum]|uniref:Uncharacterized protein n=1 Tax=Melastoma candidum TaxID=119954 RepID=A0ACB9R9Y1_9MYRT|nr:hypothetical protein MLD38_013672 [Melastoma candidum]